MRSFLLSLLLFCLLAAVPVHAAPAVFYNVCRRLDARHGTAVLATTAWQRSAATWRVGVLTDAGALDDLAGVTAISLTVTSFGGTKPGAVPWIVKTVAAADFSTPADAAAVVAGTGWHAQFALTAEDMNLPVEDSGTRAYWYEFRATMAAGDVILAAGQLVVRGTGGLTGDGRFALRTDFTGLSSDVTTLSTDAMLNKTSRLREIVSGGGYELTAISRDADDVITTATVRWPDGTGGTFTTNTKNTDFLTVDGFSLTYSGTPVFTITQPTVTRNANGAVTAKPALTVSQP